MIDGADDWVSLGEALEVYLRELAAVLDARGRAEPEAAAAGLAVAIAEEAVS